MPNNNDGTDLYLKLLANLKDKKDSQRLLSSYSLDVIKAVFRHKGLEFQRQTWPGDCQILCANLKGTKAYIYSIWQEMIHDHDVTETVFLANSETVLAMRLGKLFKEPLNQVLHTVIKSVSSTLQRLEERAEPLLSLSRNVSFSQESASMSGCKNRLKLK